DAWRAGGTMSSELAQSLREAVYPAVVAHIDWNALHLIPGDFVGAGKSFRPAQSIVFAQQFLSPGQAPIQLPIPLRGEGEDRTESALVLPGLLRFSLHRSWRFDEGGRYYRAFLRQIDSWARHVVDHVSRLST